ncbi:serine/threonine protein kinase [Streptomyces antnestii]|uniref:non-specific serine/threonine protein kinase n=1 Tax=Streptomyces antnestii TaxID=2494256 RepID=A0A437NZS4_9ACTN|nr:serine/threonine-protein kinase [Streptomyces sp. San01]RVU15525.1 serine/threonine protein kinase [Streptomyces sp. San01]
MVDSAVAEPLGSDDPQEIGSFTIIGLLGVGGMGEVYLGASGKGYAAVKRVRSRLVSHERFEREVGILYRVPAGVGPRVLASDSTAERPWFATEYVPGLTVDEAVRLRGPLPAEALWLLLAEAATHLASVHAFGIVHRDVKPGNVMLVRDGVKLIDFGIARAADQARLTKSGGSYGSQGFSAPEQQAGDEDVDAPADVYSLGALVLYAASGRTPGVVPDAEPLRAVDAGLADVIGSCLATGPGARPTAGEVAEAARAHLPVPPPSWPSEVMSRIASRRAFEATPVSKLETVPPPDLDADPTPDLDADPTPVPGADPTPVPGAVPTPVPGAVPTPEAVTPSAAVPRHQRKRLLLTAAVIALGAVAGFVLVPSTARHNSAAHTSDSASPGARFTSGAPRKSSSSPSRSGSPTKESGRPTRRVPAAGTHTTVPPRASSARSPSGPVATAASSAAATRVTSSSIPGINGKDDPAQVKGSEADTSWVGNDAACSAWLDDNGSAELAGVLNTSLNQSCTAELHRSDGIAYRFHASWGAAKTNFISDVGHTMWICVWNASDRSDEQCSAHFAMNGGTPVKQ